MNIKRYRQVRAAVAVFVGIIVSIAVRQNSYILATAGVVAGMLFLTLVRSKTKIIIDEREKTVREKAAQMTYAIFTPTIGIGAFLLLFPSYSGLSLFSKGEFLYTESLGMVFAYLTLFLISVYSISFYFLNKKYTGQDDEEQN